MVAFDVGAVHFVERTHASVGGVEHPQVGVAVPYVEGAVASSGEDHVASVGRGPGQGDADGVGGGVDHHLLGPECARLRVECPAAQVVVEVMVYQLMGGG